LRGCPEYLFWTGRLADGRQALVSGLSGLVLLFDNHGVLLDVQEHPGSPDDLAHWIAEVGLEDGPIAVKRFRVAGHRTRVEDLPGHLEDFRNNPDHPSFEEWERRDYPNEIEEWLETGQFVYHDDGADFFIGPDGEVESS